ncbi:MAG: M48 family metalloprotease [Deltaproteobacteria bacterium]|nr:M48 family metalloprotease [Deltaproteobacteria bacterium]
MQNKPFSVKKCYRYALFLMGMFLVSTSALLTPLQAEMTLTDERQLGAQFYKKLSDANRTIKNEEVSRYIEQLGIIILGGTDSSKHFFDFQFTVVDTPTINAFATPGGFIYINRGLITMADSEAELAGVVAHEIAHVLHRHISAIVAEQNRLNMATLVASIAGALLAGDMSGFIAVAGIATATSQTLALQYSRANEEEADRSALEYLISVGYNPLGSITFLRTMSKYDAYSGVVPSYMLTHPGTTERIAYLERAIAFHNASSLGITDKMGSLPKIQTLLVVGTGDAESNLHYFSDRLQKNPHNPYFLLGVAISYARMAQIDLARKYYNEALKKSPNDGYALREAGFFEYGVGNTDVAIAYLQRSLLVEDDENAKTCLAQAFLQKQQFNDVLSLYANIDPAKIKNPEVFSKLAIAYGKTGNNAYSHYFFGTYFERTKEKQVAIFHYEKALTLFSTGDRLRKTAENQIAKLQQEIAQKGRKR